MAIEIPVGARVIEIDLDTAETNVFKNVPYETHEQFYSTDIGMAYLKFTGTGDYTGCTARLSLINFNDGSKVQRIFEMDTTTTFVYTMLETELVHAGRWIGQLAVIKGGTTISDNPFRFKINGPIMSTALISFDNINTFTSQLTTIYDGLNTFLDVVILDESGRADAEGLRVVAEGLRVTEEELRVIADALRETKEGLRQSTFDANEITRTGIVNNLVTAETIAQLVAEKYQLIEATQASRLLSVEEQLAHKAEQSEVNSVQSQVDTLVLAAGNPAESSAEIVQSRTDADGRVHDTMKGHFDNVEKILTCGLSRLPLKSMGFEQGNIYSSGLNAPSGNAYFTTSIRTVGYVTLPIKTIYGKVTAGYTVYVFKYTGTTFGSYASYTADFS